MTKPPSKRLRRTLRIMKADDLAAILAYEAVQTFVNNRGQHGGHRRANIAECLNAAADFRRWGNFQRARSYLGYIKGYRE